MSSLTYDLTLAGLSVGAAAALTGIGLVVTYRATGVLNFAHGAIAMVCAYALRQCAVGWGWPLWPSAAVTLLVLAPVIGVLLERVVFRPLALSGGDPARTLVASIGVFVLLVGAAVLLWGPGARDDAPVLVSADPWGQLAVVLVLAAGVGAVSRWTRFGRELRAVVDDRRLAVLSGVDADRVAAAGWAFGSFTAGLTGVLLAPYVRLDPYGLPLLVMEVVAVAVAARMRSLPVAVGTALAIGVAQSQLTRLHPVSDWGEQLLRAVGANLFVVALLIAALALPGIGDLRDTGGTPPAGTVTGRVRTPPVVRLVAGTLFLLPLGLAGSDLHTSVQVPALGVILLSLVVVTGRGGQISLGQAAYAGLGALFTALLAAGRFPGLPRLPELAALAVAVALVAPLGLLTGRPAIRRHGLALALATFAVGVGVSRFVFAQPYATGDLRVSRPAGFDGDRAYYVLELVLLAVALLAAHALRTGRTGRALAAMRDHEPGAAAAGVRVPSLKLLAFVCGAALAALGGALLTMGLRAFDPAAYDPVRGLLWFAAVVVLGADSPLGALAAAALLVGLDAGARGGVAAALIGLLAVSVGRLRVPSRVPGAAGSPGAPLRPRPAAPPLPPGSRPPTTRPGAVHGHPGTSGTPPAPKPTGEPPRTPPGAPPPDPGSHPPTIRPGAVHGHPGTSGTPPAPGTSGEPPRMPPGAPPPDPGRRPPSARPGGTHGRPGALGPPRVTGAPGTSGPSGASGTPAAYEIPGEPPRSSPGAALPDAGMRTPAARPGGPQGGRVRGRPAGTLLTVRGLRARYGGFVALDDVGLDVRAGQITAVVGPNGAGKSTLFHCLAGTLRPAHGEVRLAGRDISRLPAHARTRLGIARTFQQPAVFPSLTVAENVQVGADQSRTTDPGAAERALRLFGLDGPVRHLPAAGLPTGTLRRVEAARALAGEPRVLLLDEPAAGLDTAEVTGLARVLAALAADGTALLVVEHDLDLVADLADVVHVMAAGRIVASGPPDRVLDAAEGMA